MSLAHALLTELIERPASGAEAARRFDRSFGYFWPASHQQIYRELARLERDGLIAAQAPATGKHRRYIVLPEGREALKGWLAEPRAAKPIRDELLVKVRAAAALEDADIVASLTDRLAQHRSKLDSYRQIETSQFATVSSREERLKLAILNTGIDLELLWIRFCVDALAAVSKGTRPEPASYAPQERPLPGAA